VTSAVAGWWRLSSHCARALRTERDQPEQVGVAGAQTHCLVAGLLCTQQRGGRVDAAVELRISPRPLRLADQPVHGRVRGIDA
jgi:hypothetical protein